jgi:hypothetical protein
MAADLNALGLMLVLLLTGVVLIRYGAWPESLWRIAGGAAAAFLLMFLAIWFGVIFLALPSVLYYDANNSHQALIPSMCLALVLIFTKPNRVCRIVALAIALSAFVLSFHFACLVGLDASYSGSPDWTRRNCRSVTLSHLRTIRLMFSYVAQEYNDSYPAGWLAETELGRELHQDDLRYTKSQSVEIHTLWHSPLTGLYCKTYRELSLWYPGGRLREGLQRMEFRPRPARERNEIQGQEKKAAASARVLPGRTSP